MKKNLKRLVTISIATMMSLAVLQACAPADDEEEWDDAGISDAATNDTAVELTCADFTGACTDVDKCEGDLLVWCNEGTTVCNDCSDVTGVALHCAMLTSDWGHDCVAGAGQACSDDYMTNAEAPNPACDPAIGSCVAGTGSQ